jgi:hypothetical protein
VYELRKEAKCEDANGCSTTQFLRVLALPIFDLTLQQFVAVAGRLFQLGPVVDRQSDLYALPSGMTFSTENIPELKKYAAFTP